jgi:hypothetical protein
MACFFFHIRDRGELIEDPDGLELPDIATARDECGRIMRGVLGEERWRHELNADRQFEITDEQGQIVLFVPLIDLASAAELPARRVAGRR